MDQGARTAVVEHAILIIDLIFYATCNNIWYAVYAPGIPKSSIF